MSTTANYSKKRIAKLSKTFLHPNEEENEGFVFYIKSKNGVNISVISEFEDEQ
jgi:hypothetical protein